MSSNEIAPPRLPEAPPEYSQQYVQDLVRALEVFIEQERNPGELRGTRITLTDLPDDVITADVNGAVSSGTNVIIDNVQNGTIVAGLIIRGTGITGTVRITTVNSQTDIDLDTSVTLSDNTSLTLSDLGDGALYNDSGTVKVA